MCEDSGLTVVSGQHQHKISGQVEKNYNLYQIALYHKWCFRKSLDELNRLNLV